MVTTKTGDVAADLLADGSLTIDAITRQYGIGRSAIYDLMKEGKLPYSQATGRRLVPRRAVVKLLAAEMVGVPAVAEMSGQ
ncbi:MAG: helix-turn-helix domain-containing protein [Planctomycetia bacterium]|nr:helix-turn-helix domain-containing protein [Planctomycetia bacterium]